METLEPGASSGSRGKWVLGLVGGVLFVALIAAGVVLVPRLLNTGAGMVNVTAAAMPADTQIYFSFNPHYDQLPNGDVIRKAWTDPALFKPFEDQVRDGLKENDLDWEQDIASWLGDEVGVGIGHLPVNDLNSLDPPQPALVLIATTRDASKSDALLVKLRSASEEKGASFTEQAYRDVATVVQTADRTGESLAYATLNDLVIVASGPDPLHAAIDAALDGAGLDTSGEFRTAMSKLRGGRALTAYVDVANVVKPILEQMPPAQLPASFDPSALEVLSLAMGLSFEPNGALLEFITSGDPAIPLPVEAKSGAQAEPNPNRLLRSVPDSTFLYISGRRLSDALIEALAGIRQALAQAQSADPGVEDPLAEFERETGIDLAKDLFSWMTGETAFAMMPGAGFSPSNPIPFGFALIVEAGDPALAESATHKLFTALTAQSQAEIEDVRVGESRLHGLVDSATGNSVLVYGLIGDQFVLAMPEATAQKIAGAGDRPLADDETFKQAVAPLPSNAIGYVYFKPKSIVDLMTLGLAFSGQECAACSSLEPIRALAFTIEYPPAEAGIVRSALFMLLDVEP